MTQRSIQAGETETVIIRVGADVQVEGWDEDRVLAETDSRWGLKLERRTQSSIGRVRARVGNRVLLDMQLGAAGLKKKGEREDAIEVQIGVNGRVHVPRNSNVKVYAGKSIEARDLQGSLTAYAGLYVRIRNVHTLLHASAGGALDFECDRVESDDVKFAAGRDLRCYIKSLTDAKVMVNDLGGYWEGIIGDGRQQIRLQAGGDVTLVTDRQVKAQPPDYVLGTIVSPDKETGGSSAHPTSPQDLQS